MDPIADAMLSVGLCLTPWTKEKKAFDDDSVIFLEEKSTAKRTAAFVSLPKHPDESDNNLIASMKSRITALLNSNLTDNNAVSIHNNTKIRQFLYQKRKKQQCKYCTKYFFRRFALDFHIQTDHLGIGANNSSTSPISDSLVSSDNVNSLNENGAISFFNKPKYSKKSNRNFMKYQCKYCSKLYCRRGALDFHMRVVHQGGARIRNSRTISSVSTDKILRNEDTISIANTIEACDNSIHNSSTISSVSTDSILRNEDPILITNTIEACEDTIQIHEKQCKDSPKLYDHLVDLNSHTRRNQNAEKLFCCKDCPAKFAKEPSLTKHERIHDGRLTFDFAADVSIPSTI